MNGWMGGLLRFVLLPSMLLVGPFGAEAHSGPAPHLGPTTPSDPAQRPDRTPRSDQASPSDPLLAPPDTAEFIPDFEPGDWDSVLAAYDEGVREGRRARLTPEFGLRYSKVEGLHLEAGAGVGAEAVRVLRAEIRGGYDVGRERPTGSALLRVALLRPDRLSLDLGIHSGVRPFGRNDPYANTLLAFFAGYDSRVYLHENAGHAYAVWRIDPERWAGIGWVRHEHRPLATVTDFRVFGGSDRWMRWNVPAQREVENGLRVFARRQPPYAGETRLKGLWVESAATLYGGDLGGTREYAIAALDFWYNVALPWGDAVQLRGSAGAAGGRPPIQALPDLGGDAGLRGFPPRGFGTPDSLVGTQRLLAHLEVRHDARFLRKSRIPLVDQLRLTLVPFVETGAVWGDPARAPLRSVSDLHLPRRCEWLWDLGIGVRQGVDLAGIVSFVQVDLAWPMGADTGPPRVALRISRHGLE